MCDLFVHKNPDLPITEQDEQKERLLLSPRGCFKTTIDICDIVQWILCFPNITILILSGTQDLAAKMVHEVRWHFINNQVLRLLFPTYCLPKEEKRERETYMCPARTDNIREETLEISTITSTKSGSHYWLIKADDTIHDKNSTTLDQLQKASEAIDATIPLLNPGGYFDFVGTRYAVADAYGKQLEFNTAKILIQQAWKIREDRKPEVDPKTNWPILTADDVDLLFPERLSFKHLHKIYKKNPYLFCCQYLQAPEVKEAIQFSLDDLQLHTIPYTQLPNKFSLYIQWDFAGAKVQTDRDNHACIVGMVDEKGRLYVVDMLVGRFYSYQVAAQVVEMSRRWNPIMNYCEDAMGSSHLEPLVLDIANRNQVTVPMTWLPSPRFKQAKEHRISYLHTLLTSDRLFFLEGIPHLDLAYKEFTTFPHGKTDDIPDSIAQLVNNVLRVGSSEATTFLTTETMEKRRQEALWRHIFEPPEPEAVPREAEQAGPLGYGLRA